MLPLVLVSTLLLAGLIAGLVLSTLAIVRRLSAHGVGHRRLGPVSPCAMERVVMAMGARPTRQTRRQKELAERPNCAVCGIKVVRKTSDLIDGKLWCLSCCRGPRRSRRNQGPVRQRRRHLFNTNPFCKYCSCELQWEASTVDHVVPLSKGGSNDPENLVLACNPCNSRKGSKLLGEDFDLSSRTIDEWARALVATRKRVLSDSEHRVRPQP